MITKDGDCNLVQESIAWGKALSLADKKHILDCGKCSAIAAQFEELDSLMKNESMDIPFDFADRVMQKIIKQEEKKSLISFPDLIEAMITLLDNSILRWGIGGVGFLFAFSAL